MPVSGHQLSLMSCLVFLTHSESRDDKVVGDIDGDTIDEMTIGGKRVAIIAPRRQDLDVEVLLYSSYTQEPRRSILPFSCPPLASCIACPNGRHHPQPQRSGCPLVIWSLFPPRRVWPSERTKGCAVYNRVAWGRTTFSSMVYLS